MALVKFGGGIIQASGSIAGTVHARNRFGNYIRARTKPVNPNSSWQNKVRQALAVLAAKWGGLTPENRILWATYAQAIAMKNRLGETVYLTGFNHYIRSNLIRLIVLGTTIDVGPSELTLPEGDSTAAVTATVAGQSMGMTFDVNNPWCVEPTGFMVWFQGQPRMATQNFFNGPWRRLVATIGVAETGAVSPETHASNFGFIAGQKISVYARICRADGRLTEPIIMSCTAA